MRTAAQACWPPRQSLLTTIRAAIATVSTPNIGTPITVTKYSKTEPQRRSRRDLVVTDEDGGTSLLATQTIAVDNDELLRLPPFEGTPITVTATATEQVRTTPFATNSGVDLTNFVFTPDDNGSYEIQLVVTDEDGGSSTLQAQTITVDNDDPVFNTGADETLVPADAGLLTRLLTFTDLGVLDTHTVDIDFGDGNTSAITNATSPFTISNTYAADGNYLVAVTITDKDLGSTTDSFTVSVDVNDPPVAVDDVVTTDQDTNIVINVLADNGNGADSDDENNIDDTLTTLVGSTPVSGDLVNNGDGTFTFDPNGDFDYLAVGEDDVVNFEYQIVDAFGETSQASVTITVSGKNDAPVADNLSGMVNEDGPTTTVTADFDDVDASDTHTYGVNTSGTIGLVTNNGDGTFTYDPNGQFDSLGTGDSATDTFQYIVTDSAGESSTASVTITIEGQDGNAALESQSYTLEAEDFHISGFRAVHSTTASNNEIVRLNNFGRHDDIRTFFDGESGTYDVSIFIQDENDGQSDVTLEINHQFVGGFQLDQDSDGPGDDNGTFSEFIIPNVTINDGDKIAVFVDGDGNEYGRIDKVVLTGEDKLVRDTTPFTDVVDELFSSGADDWTNPQTEMDLSGNEYLGGFGRTSNHIDTAKMFSIREGTEQATIEFDFLEIDSWDNEEFSIFVNGQEIELGRFRHWVDEGATNFNAGNGISVEKDAAVDISGYGRNSGSSAFLNDNLHRFRVTVDDPGEVLQIGFGADLSGNANNESWGVDNLRLTTDGNRIVGDPFTESVDNDDFSGGAADWSDPQTDADNSGNAYLGGFGKNSGIDTQRIYELPKDTEKVTINFDFLEIDSWDNEKFRVIINDQIVELGRFRWNRDEVGEAFEVGNGIWVQKSAAVDISGIGFNRSSSAWNNDNLHHFTIIVTEPGSHLKLGFDSSLNASSDNESWGVDNLSIDADGVDLLLDLDFDVVVADENFDGGNAAGWEQLISGNGRIDYTGDALELDGHNDYGFIPANTSHDLTDGSVKLTFNADSVHGRNGIFSRDSRNFDGGGHLTMWVENKRVKVRLQSTNQSFTITSSVQVSRHTDYEVQLDFGAGGMNLYLDGNLVGTNSYTGGITGNSEPIVLGASQWRSDDGVANIVEDFFNGTLSNFALEDSSGNDVSNFAGSGLDYLGGFGDTDDDIVARKTFDLPVDTTRAQIEFDFLEIDSWDNEQFLIEINGQVYDLGRYRWQNDEDAETYFLAPNIFVEKSAAVDISGFGTSGSSSRHNDNLHHFRITIENPTESLTIGFGSTLNSDSSNESWGVDNLTVRALGDELTLD